MRISPAVFFSTAGATKETGAKSGTLEASRRGFTAPAATRLPPSVAVQRAPKARASGPSQSMMHCFSTVSPARHACRRSVNAGAPPSQPRKSRLVLRTMSHEGNAQSGRPFGTSSSDLNR